MGFIFGLVGALLGAFFMSTGRGFFGFLIGMMIGYFSPVPPKQPDSSTA